MNANAFTPEEMTILAGSDPVTDSMLEKGRHMVSEMTDEELRTTLMVYARIATPRQLRNLLLAGLQ